MNECTDDEINELQEKLLKSKREIVVLMFINLLEFITIILLLAIIFY